MDEQRRAQRRAEAEQQRARVMGRWMRRPWWVPLLISIGYLASFGIRDLARGRHVVDLSPPILVVGWIGGIGLVVVPAFVAGMAYHAQHETKSGESSPR